MKTYNFWLTGFLLLTSVITIAQVGIGTAAPATSAGLEVSSTNKGFLPPRMNKVQRNGIATPVAGLIVWCNDCGEFGQIQVFNGSSWTDMLGGPPAGLAIGDVYGGGKVAHILQAGDPGYTPGQLHGFIAAPADQSTGAQWGCLEILIGGTGTLLGTGQANTTAIVNECATQGIAARICHDLVLNGYTDWHLPSKDELNKLYLGKAILGGFASGEYWTSSESTTEVAWVQSFVNGMQSFNFKGYPAYVRAVRPF